MKAAIYARVSTKDKGQDATNQLIAMRDWAAAFPGVTSIEEYVDEVSGGKGEKDRPRFARMMQEAMVGKVKLVLFWSLDRLSREGALPTLQYLNRLSEYGCAWRSFSEQYLDSTGLFKDAVISILAAVARAEKVRISERTKAGLNRAKAAGKVLGKPKADIDEGRLRQLRIVEKKSVREIAEAMGLKRGAVHNALVRIGLDGPLPDENTDPDLSEPAVIAVDEPAESLEIASPRSSAAECASIPAAVPAARTLPAPLPMSIHHSPRSREDWR